MLRFLVDVFRASNINAISSKFLGNAIPKFMHNMKLSV